MACGESPGRRSDFIAAVHTHFFIVPISGDTSARSRPRSQGPVVARPLGNTHAASPMRSDMRASRDHFLFHLTHLLLCSSHLPKSCFMIIEIHYLCTDRTLYCSTTALSTHTTNAEAAALQKRCRIRPLNCSYQRRSLRLRSKVRGVDWGLSAPRGKAATRPLSAA